MLNIYTVSWEVSLAKPLTLIAKNLLVRRNSIKLNKII